MFLYFYYAMKKKFVETRPPACQTGVLNKESMETPQLSIPESMEQNMSQMEKSERYSKAQSESIL